MTAKSVLDIECRAEKEVNNVLKYACHVGAMYTLSMKTSVSTS